MSNPDLYHELFTKLADDIDEANDFPARRPLLAHYTSIAVLEQMVANKEIWFSHPLAMNDHEEMTFGMNEGANAFRAHQGLVEACRGAERHRRLNDAFEEALQNFWRYHAFDTYVFSASEHADDDVNGQLSLWRGYGGNGFGAAIVFDTEKFTFIPSSPFVLGPVYYESREKRLAWANGRLDLLASLLQTMPIPDDQLHVPAIAYLERLKIASIFSKDIGFKEENEWRAVYRTDRDTRNLLEGMRSYAVGRQGIEPKLKLKIAPLADVFAEDTCLEKFVDRIILGPTQTGVLAAPTVRRMLEKHDMAGLTERVFTSTTPFRAT